ncbi:MAG: GTPase ObgE [Bacteroidetes bacterium]|jgi:GTPase|nr:MAG: GTPase ObgE [Bacteroidota bacterium]
MSESFVDYVKIYFTSGKGGDGVVSWRREKYVPKGGPNGGDGGRGGHVIVRGNAQLWTLLDLKYRKFIHAEAGMPGESNNCTGRSGKDEIVDVPLGTLVRDDETGEVVAEILHDGQELLLLEGGWGGKGNTFYKTATHQAPDFAGKGGPPQEMQVVFELKVLADVGLVGFPNAGKSTLLSVVSAARPKIADYAFTTLVPNLGIVRYRDNLSFVMADIPGIIEGAHQGRGLGTQFLRHIERNSVLLFMVSVDTDDIRKQYEILLNEVHLYNEELTDKPRMLAITKCDMIDEGMEAELLAELSDLHPVFISSVAQKGLDALKQKLWALLNPEQ